MKSISITGFSKYLIPGLLVLMTACSRLINVLPTSEAAITTNMSSQDTNALSTTAVQTIQAQMPAHAGATATLLPPTATQIEVALPTTTTAPTRYGIGDADGKVTEASIAIQLEQGSGTVCTTDSTYFVHASITTDGPAIASYEIGSTAGQIAAGYFQDATGDLSPYVTGTVIFDQADTKNIHLRFVGPYPYPDDITVFLRVNGGEFYNAKLSCQE